MSEGLRACPCGTPLRVDTKGLPIDDLPTGSIGLSFEQLEQLLRTQPSQSLRTLRDLISNELARRAGECMHEWTATTPAGHCCRWCGARRA